MWRKRVAAASAALIVALAPMGTSAQENERSGEAIIADVIDASVKNADLLASGSRDSSTIRQVLGERDVQVIQLQELLDDNRERSFADVIDASEVLSSNRLAARNVVMANDRLMQALSENAVSADRVVAVDLTVPVPDAVTIYVLDIEELNSPPTAPRGAGAP